MNNDLEQFSEERLEGFINRLSAGNMRDAPKLFEMISLARIALAAKQAKPEYYIVRLELNDAWGNETVLNAYETQNDASKCKDDHGGVIIPVYTTPPANSPEIPDGWKLVPITATIEMHKAAEKEYSLQKMYSAMLRAAPKPESE